MTPYENFTNGAIAARKLADEYMDEAAYETNKARREYLINEAAKRYEHAEDYEMRASWYAPKEEQRKEAA